MRAAPLPIPAVREGEHPLAATARRNRVRGFWQRAALDALLVLIPDHDTPDAVKLAAEAADQLLDAMLERFPE